MNDAEESVRFLLDATPYSVILIDKNFKCIYVNDEAVRLNGLSSKQEYFDMYSQGRLVLERGGEYIRKAFIEGNWRGELIAKRPDGEAVPCEITLIRLKYMGDDVIAGYARDLREKKAAVKKIRETEEEKQTIEEAHRLLRNILDIMPVSVIITSRGDGTLLYANKAALDTFKSKSFEEVAKKNKSFDFMPETQPDGSNSIGIIEEFRKREKGVKDLQFIKMTGENFLGRLSYCYINYFGTEASINVIEDITEEKNSLANLMNILNGLDTMIYVTDPNTDRILFINDKMINHFGIDKNCIGELCYKILQKDMNERCSFCPCNRHSKDSQDMIVWEENNPLTKRVYRNTDRYIDWPNGKRVHLQHSVDITDLKQTQENLSNQNLRLNLLVGGLNVGLWDRFVDPALPYDANESRIWWSDEFRNLLGFTDENDFPNKIGSWLDRVHPDDLDLTVKAMTAFLEDKTDKITYNVENRIRLKNGEYRWFRSFGSAIRDSDGNPIRTAGATEDINERKRLHENLQHREKMLGVLNEMANIFLSHENDSFNDVMSKGIKPIADVMNLNRVAVYRRFDHTGRMGQIYLWMHGNTVVLDEELLELPDIPPVKRWLEILKKGEYVHNRAGDVPEDQAEFMGLFGIKAILFVPVFVRREFWGVVTLENLNDDKYFNEDCIDLMLSAAHLCASAVVRNEVEREIAEKNELLEIALQNAENANKAKSVFLATISHEIRTPMNAILGITEMQMQNKSLPSDTQEALDRIYNSGNLLLNIINDILDLSKIEAGKLEITPDKYDLLSLINDTVQLNWLHYESKPIEFLFDIDENTPLNLYGDELRIRQILNNVLSNAFKYTDKGEVRLSVYTEQPNGKLIMENGKDNSQLSTFNFQFENEVYLIFTVSDTGQGMTEEQLGKLFDEYTRFNLNTNRDIMGAGLGMNITKRLLELMNGGISVVSEVGKGSVFTVRLPQKRIDSAVCGKETAEKLRNSYNQNSLTAKKSRILYEYMPYGSVLIVDDLEMNIYVTKGMLVPYGLKVDSASSGLEAIEKIKAGNVYDIIFMDHMMPKMDGIETVKIIRGMEYKHYIIALTANALVGQAQMFLNNGFDGYISKPIDSRELNQVLNDFIRNKKPPEVVAAAREEAKARNNKQGKSPEKALNNNEEAMFFILDAENAVKTLEGIDLNPAAISEAEIDTFEITVHGMKNVLSVIGEAGLSAEALNLEKAARERNLTEMAEKTPAFLDSIRLLIYKFKAVKEAGINAMSNAAINDDDKTFLSEKLKCIKAACDTFNSNAARKALEDLLLVSWPPQINEVLEEISNYLLESAFKKASQAIDEYAKKYENNEI